MVSFYGIADIKKVGEVLEPSDEHVSLEKFVDLLRCRGFELIDLASLSKVSVWRLEKMFAYNELPISVIIGALDALYPRIAVVSSAPSVN